jgi:hypothetical protein
MVPSFGIGVLSQAPALPQPLAVEVKVIPLVAALIVIPPL